MHSSREIPAKGWHLKTLFMTGSLVHGGAERHTITRVNRLAERGHECHAVYVKNDPSQLERLRHAASIECLRAARYFDAGAVRRLAATIEREQPTSILAANQYAMLYASLARRLAGSRAPLAVVWHTTFVNTAKEHVQMLYYRPFFWNADCVVYVCEAQRRHWHPRLVRGRRNEVIHNGVDTDHWKPAARADRARTREQLGFAETDYVIGLSAVLRPEKNHVQLVEAIAMLRRRGVRARALLIGDGPTRSAVEERARALGVSGHVIITGLQRDVRPFVAAADTMVLTSFAEALSLAALEAMAMGKPVVHSDVGGAAEIIRPGREGFLFPVGDTAALVDHLAVLARPGVRAPMGANARERVELQLSERAMVDRYEKLLTQLESPAASVEPVPAAETIPIPDEVRVRPGLSKVA
jgi:glycosyltransferase involved in cell wall biosynthesis